MQRSHRPNVLMNLLRRTWLATTLFVIVSSAIWWPWLGWEIARDHLVAALLLTPLIWWAAIGRKTPPHLLRGAVAGALTGLVTQMAPHLRYFLPLVGFSRPGDGEAQMVALASVAIYLMIATGAVMMGAVVGLATAAIERRTHLWT